MSNNDQIILDKTLEQQRAERAPHLEPDKYFELFVAEQLLKHFDLSYDEIEPGLVDGGATGELTDSSFSRMASLSGKIVI